jgi:hypothetical protein
MLNLPYVNREPFADFWVFGLPSDNSTDTGA